MIYKIHVSLFIISFKISYEIIKVYDLESLFGSDYVIFEISVWDIVLKNWHTHV